MIRALTLATAVLLACETQANAAAATSITFDGFCDGMKISHSGIHFASKQTGKCLDKKLVMGSGFEIVTGKKPVAGYVVLGVNWEPFDGKKNEQYSYMLQFPFVTGGHWQEIFTTDGLKNTVLTKGTYTVVGGRVMGRTGPFPTSWHSGW